MHTYYKSKATRLAEVFLKDIWRGRYSREGFLPAEEELARAYGVSRMTIRKVLASLERDGVLVKVPNCGNRINPELNLPESAPVEAEVASAVEITIGAVVAAFPNALNIDVNRGIADYARQNGIAFRLIQDIGGSASLIQKVHQLHHAAISGLIWFDNRAVVAKDLAVLAATGFPMICVDNPSSVPAVPYVGVDNFGGMYAATSELLRFFRNGVYYLGYQPYLHSQQQRYGGYCQAMEDFGLKSSIQTHSVLFHRIAHEPNDWLMPKQDNWIAEAAKILLSAKAPFGVVAENDYIAQIVMHTAEHLKLQVGRDFFIWGFDDLPLAETLGLSSIRQPRYELGYEAARQLVAMIKNRSCSASNIILPVQLSSRQSTDFSSLNRESKPVKALNCTTAK